MEHAINRGSHYGALQYIRLNYYHRIVSKTRLMPFLQPAEPEELTIEVVLDADSESEMESEVSEVSEAPPEEDITVESSMTGPMHK